MCVCVAWIPSVCVLPEWSGVRNERCLWSFVRLVRDRQVGHGRNDNSLRTNHRVLRNTNQPTNHQRTNVRTWISSIIRCSSSHCRGSSPHNRFGCKVTWWRFVPFPNCGKYLLTLVRSRKNLFVVGCWLWLLLRLLLLLLLLVVVAQRSCKQ